MNRSPLDDRRIWLGGAAFVALVIVAVSWLFLISPKLSSADDLRSQKATTDQQNQQLQHSNDNLKLESQQIDTLRANLRKAVNGLPGTTAYSSFTVELTDFAAASGVAINSISITAPTQSADAAAAAPAPAAGSGDTTTTPVTTNTTAAPTGQQSISVSVNTTGPLVNQLVFVKALEKGPRRLLIGSTQIGVTGGARTNSVDSATTMTTQLTIFYSPTSANQAAQLRKLLGNS